MDRIQALTATTIPPFPGDAYEERLRRSEMAIGYRILREIEVAPGWWGIAREVGETVSAQVANEYCDEQNVVTMDLNRAKRHRYTVEPLYAATDSDPDMDEALRRVREDQRPAVTR